MNDISDLSRIAAPKSDQLNADDLISGPITVTIQNVSVGGTDDQPISLHIGNGMQPYKPCKSMRRLLLFVWGKDGNQWIGKTITLFNDPTVKWAGKEVGGIRISHVTGIDKDTSLSLTETRGKRKPYTVKKLELPVYAQTDFDANLGKWSDLIQSGKATAQIIINKISAKAMLSQQQLDTLNSITQTSQDDDNSDL